MLSRRSPSLRSSFATLLISLLAGCTAETGESTAQPGAGGSGVGGAASNSAGAAADPTCSSTTPDVGSSILRRLSGLEYQLTLQDLFQLAPPPSLDGLPADT